jgi:hypothetical protein
MRKLNQVGFFEQPILKDIGLTSHIIKDSLEYTYGVLDSIDHTLIDNNQPRLSGLVELANLSAIIGNLFRSGIERFSNGYYIKNAPHKHPDLLHKDNVNEGIEIKIALEKNKPKGHLIKPGLHLTLRYVLGDLQGKYIQGANKRGDVIWVWEIRAGYLKHEHFSFSNTEGDSGKTAVITSEGMEQLQMIYCGLDHIPYSKSGSIYRRYESKVNGINEN